MNSRELMAITLQNDSTRIDQVNCSIKQENIGNECDKYHYYAK